MAGHPSMRKGRRVTGSRCGGCSSATCSRSPALVSRARVGSGGSVAAGRRAQPLAGIAAQGLPVPRTGRSKAAPPQLALHRLGRAGRRLDVARQRRTMDSPSGRSARGGSATPPSFNSKNERIVTSLKQAIARAPGWRDRDVIVFDVRTNGGGNSRWGSEILRACTAGSTCRRAWRRWKRRLSSSGGVPRTTCSTYSGWLNGRPAISARRHPPSVPRRSRAPGRRWRRANRCGQPADASPGRRRPAQPGYRQGVPAHRRQLRQRLPGLRRPGASASRHHPCGADDLRRLGVHGERRRSAAQRDCRARFAVKVYRIVPGATTSPTSRITASPAISATRPRWSAGSQLASTRAPATPVLSRRFSPRRADTCACMPPIHALHTEPHGSA